MDDMGVGAEYVVLKTVPFGMEDATKEDWDYVLQRTRMYRKNVLRKLLEDGTPSVIITDGPHAKAEADRMLSHYLIPRVAIERGTDSSSDMKKAATEIKKIAPFKNLKATAQMNNIPRSHLSFYARTWEGTSGDRVLN